MSKTDSFFNPEQYATVAERIELFYERYPQVPKVNFSQIKLPKVEKAAVSEKAIEEVVEEIKHSHASFEAVEGAGHRRESDR